MFPSHDRQVLQNARDFRDVVVSTKDAIQQKAQQLSDWYNTPYFPPISEREHTQLVRNFYLPDAPPHDYDAQISRHKARRYSKRDLSHWFSGNKLISSRISKREYGGYTPVNSPYTYPLSIYPTRPSDEYVDHYTYYRPIDKQNVFAYYNLYPKKKPIVKESAPFIPIKQSTTFSTPQPAVSQPVSTSSSTSLTPSYNMAYRRMRYRRRSYRRPRYRSRMLSRRQPRITGARSSMRALLVKEKKFVDTNVNVSSIISTSNTNSDIYFLNGVQTGAAPYNRVGRKIYMLSVRISGTVTCVLTTGPGIPANNFRMIVVYDSRPTSSLPTFDEIFLTVDQTGATSSSSMQSNRNVLTGNRFRILRDVRLPFSAPSALAATTGTVASSVDIFVKLPNLVSEYQSNSNPSTIADCVGGALYLIVRGGVNDAQTTFNCNLDTRLRFTD